MTQLRTIYAYYCFMRNIRKKVEMEALRKSKLEEKLTSLKSRAKIMEEKLQSADADYQIATSKKAEFDLKIEQLNNKKTLKDSELKEQKIRSLELQMALIKSPESFGDGEELKLTGERVKLLEKEAKELEEEVKVVLEEAKGVNEDAEEAEGSLRGIVQILEVMEAEMELHESQLKTIAGAGQSLRKIGASLSL